MDEAWMREAFKRIKRAEEAYIEGITMPITKHNFTVRKVEDLADTMRAAFRIAQSGRKGPCWWIFPRMSPRTPASSPTKSRS